jgi:hypothetical protein
MPKRATINARNKAHAKSKKNSSLKGTLTRKVDRELKRIDIEDDNKNELHTRLHPDINFTLNSINVLVGTTGSGKSRAVFREIMKLKYLDQSIMPYHQFVYVTDEDNDKTYLKYKHLISLPIITVGLEEAGDLLSKIIEYKNIYEALKRGDETGGSEEELYELLDFLTVNDFEKPILHTLVLFDDATDLFKNNGKKLNPLLALILKNRHHKYTYFFNIHNFTCNTLPMTIKKNIRSLWYFGGYSPLDFDTSFRQLKSPYSRDQLHEVYKHLSKRDVLFFDYTSEGTNVEIMNLESKRMKKRDNEGTYYLACEEKEKEEEEEEGGNAIEEAEAVANVEAANAEEERSYTDEYGYKRREYDENGEEREYNYTDGIEDALV